jgi:hypothetical protein
VSGQAVVAAAAGPLSPVVVLVSFTAPVVLVAPVSHVARVVVFHVCHAPAFDSGE